MRSSNASQSAAPLGLIQDILGCFFSPPTSFVYTAYNLCFLLLLLPVCCSVLLQGLRTKTRPSSSSSSSAPSVSHSDCLTYHMVAMEMLGVVGSALLASCGWAGQQGPVEAGFVLVSLAWYGETLFQCLICAERHLAVVYPLAYRRLRSERGVRLRNAAVAVTWVSSSVVSVVLRLVEAMLVTNLLFFLFCLVLVSFCSVSVLRALIRPGPGERGGARKQVDRSKRRAFCTVAVVLGVLLVRFLGNLMWVLALVLGPALNCIVTATAVWFNLPGNLALPLLFLLRRR